MNIPLLILALLRFGKKFVFLTIYTTALSSLIMDLLAPYAAQVAPMTDDMTVIALCGAALDGLGLGLVFRAGGCTGGSDIIIKFLRQRYRAIRTGGMALIINSAVVALSFVVFRDFEITIYSALAMIVASYVLDKVLYSGDSAKLVFVISDHAQEITDRVLSSMHVGITLLDGEGAYMKTPKKVILCVARKHSFPKVRDVVKEIDPHAFCDVSSATEIFGKGCKNRYRRDVNGGRKPRPAIRCTMLKTHYTHYTQEGACDAAPSLYLLLSDRDAELTLHGVEDLLCSLIASSTVRV